MKLLFVISAKNDHHFLRLIQTGALRAEKRITSDESTAHSWKYTAKSLKNYLTFEEKPFERKDLSDFSAVSK